MSGRKNWLKERGDEGSPNRACSIPNHIPMLVTANPLRLYPMLELPADLHDPAFLSSIRVLDFYEGEGVATALEALGEPSTAARMRGALGNLEVLTFAEELLRVAEKLEEQYRQVEAKPKPYRRGQRPMKQQEVSVGWVYFSTLEEAIAGIRDAAAWYQAVGGVNCSVEVSD